MSIDLSHDSTLEYEARRHDIETERAIFAKPEISRSEFLRDYLVNIENVMPVPQGHVEVDLMLMNKRLFLTDIDLLDKKGSEIKYFHKGENSDLLLSQTPREFFATIDRVLVELGISIVEVGKLQHDMITGDFEQFATSKGKLLELVEPAYVKLREMGYARKDLVQ